MGKNINISKKPHNGNFAQLILDQCDVKQDLKALSIPKEWNDEKVTSYESISYRNLKSEIIAYQAGLLDAGFTAGDRIIVMFPPSIELYSFVLALLATGMVPVFIDTGMGLSKFLKAIKDSQAKVIVSMGKLLKFRFIFPVMWQRKLFSVDSKGLGVKPLSDLYSQSNNDLSIHHCNNIYHGLITFTSGSTGRPKGADRTHASLIEQHMAIRKSWPDQEDDVDMTCFPVVVLHNLSCGIHSVLASVDLAAPGSVNPTLINQQVKEFKVTRVSAAPAFINRISDYLIEKKICLDSIREMAIGGAPVPPSLCKKLKKAFTDSHIHIAYGSTEAEPISSILVEEILQSPGKGLLVGKPYPFITVKIVHLPDDPDSIDDITMKKYTVSHGKIGEIIVKGAHVLKGYVNNPEANKENKIPCPDGEVWHRTGDTGYFDKKGRLWLTGRMNDVVIYNGKFFQPFLIELEIDTIDGIKRCAFLQVNEKKAPVIVLQLLNEKNKRSVLTQVSKKLENLSLSDIDIVCHDIIPVDNRHNSKIDRVSLRKSIS